ncbi:hypothetical protein F511_21336 [Dorcoceras hygrometricum]|uniref:Uncharacterized protein n=1 Tax=Dorcoceras hygrometricum TaxID=472368 RepID=A0A2Z7BAP0_9LAMI|nr:hypothetical protein F511_21336 [Dorcoceras hygrometricum]
MVAMLDLFWLLLEVDHKCRDLQTLHTYENHRYFISVFGIRNSRIKLKLLSVGPWSVERKLLDTRAELYVRAELYAGLGTVLRARRDLWYCSRDLLSTVELFYECCISDRRVVPESFVPPAVGFPGSSAGQGGASDGGAS